MAKDRNEFQSKGKTILVLTNVNENRIRTKKRKNPLVARRRGREIGRGKRGGSERET